MSGADLRHIDTWLFDLDNTLYPLGSGLAVKVSARITDFVAGLTGLPRDEAHGLQKRYLADYGLTLRGMMLHHDVDPDAYHAHLRDVPLDDLAADPALNAAIAALPGRRLIFTNADEAHAARVLERLGMADLFEAVFHIASAGFHPKPSAEAFDRLVRAQAITAASTAFFEDAKDNLAPAAALGMTTVLVGDEATPAPFIDYVTNDLAGFLTAARRKETC